ncbi:hypothetical protein SLEP1_g38030 [Rubroshorea leprosula]|uniref:Uncharacterized protein n=1 Tax=Rubroshorea leprosula TaxID=152421 RepID=A0AAV5KWZ7_9ROSI|nr:hypothetical protein SLEP1_g38030 [Rubroshorea leprosula]
MGSQQYITFFDYCTGNKKFVGYAAGEVFGWALSLQRMEVGEGEIFEIV